MLGWDVLEHHRPSSGSNHALINRQMLFRGVVGLKQAVTVINKRAESSRRIIARLTWKRKIGDIGYMEKLQYQLKPISGKHLPEPWCDLACVGGVPVVCYRWFFNQAHVQNDCQESLEFRECEVALPHSLANTGETAQSVAFNQHVRISEKQK